MKVLSQNLHHHQEIDIYEKYELLAELIASNDVDIIALQEVGQSTYLPIVYERIRYGNSLEVLKTILQLKYNVEYITYQEIFKNSYGERYEEGLGFLVKKEYKVENFRSIQASEHTEFNDWENRKAVSLNINGTTYINVHLGWTTEREKFEHQIDKLLNTQNLESQFYIMGDFNVGFQSKEIEYVKNLGLFNLEQPEMIGVASWTDKAENERLDYVFSNSDYFKKMEFVFENYEISDHKGILFET